MPDEVGATWLPNSNCFASREGHTPRYVVLHGTAGGISAAQIASYFQSTQGGENPVSSHYIVDQQGLVVQCVSEADGAWANGVLSAGHAAYWQSLGGVNPNNVSISIEHVKASFDNADPLTEAQKAASFQLIEHVCRRHGIPMRAADEHGGIASHASLDPVTRANCPGAYPWEELFACLQHNSLVPAGWRDDQERGVLHAPNGYVVIQGFRSYVLSHPWAADNWPLENEHHCEQLERSNAALGGGSIQRFRKTTLEWTPRAGLAEQWMGVELMEVEHLLSGTINRAPTVSVKGGA